MNILLEGPDGAGKTTLFNSLKEFWSKVKPYAGIEYIHNSYIEDDESYYKSNDELAKKLYKNTSSWDNVIVVDRFLLSEMVYGNIVRDNSRVEFWEVIRSNNLFDKIYVCLPFDLQRLVTEHESLKKERDEYVDDSQIFENICRFYSNSLEWMAPKHFGEFKRYDKYTDQFFNLNHIQ